MHQGYVQLDSYIYQYLKRKNNIARVKLKFIYTRQHPFNTAGMREI